MSELELVWIRECEVCAREHRHIETQKITSVDEIEIESVVFKDKCESWYQLHLKRLLRDQIRCTAGVAVTSSVA